MNHVISSQTYWIISLLCSLYMFCYFAVGFLEQTLSTHRHEISYFEREMNHLIFIHFKLWPQGSNPQMTQRMS